MSRACTPVLVGVASSVSEETEEVYNYTTIITLSLLLLLLLLLGRA